MDRCYSEAQLSKFRRLIRLACRWLFAGDLSERIQELTAREAFQEAPNKVARRTKPSEANLAVILIDALSCHEGWLSEDKFAEKLGLAVKPVRRTLQFLERQGFVSREHRRERKQGDNVASEAAFEGVNTSEARTATYLSIDYPLMFDMLRLRVYLAKKRAADKIDDGETLQQYACCSPDGVSSVCGKKYNSFDMNFLPIDDEGFFRCSTCDVGIVAPDDELSKSEPCGVKRIRRLRCRREAATAERQALLKELKPLDEAIARLENVDPPDFGSFTDWAQKRQEAIREGKVQVTAGSSRGGGGRGHLDYGIDGPLPGDAQVRVDDDAPGSKRARLEVEEEGPTRNPRDSLPEFMRGGPGTAAAEEAAAPAEVQMSDEERQRQEAYYEAFRKQYEAQVAAMQRAAAVKVEVKTEVKTEGGAATDVTVKQEPGQEVAGAEPLDSKAALPGGGEDVAGVEWEDAGGGDDDAAGDDVEWEDA